MRNPHPVTDAYINYLVLGVAFAFEAGAWWIAWKAFRAAEGARGILAAVRRSKDPAVFTVLFEDTAAMLGLLVAAVGLAVGQILAIPELDGATLRMALASRTPSPRCSWRSSARACCSVRRPIRRSSPISAD